MQSDKLNLAGIRIHNTTTRDWNIGVWGSGNGALSGGFHIFDYAANAVRMVVDTSGNVGIGTTNPGTKLQVVESGSYSAA